jgi:hypothetical protein
MGELPAGLKAALVAKGWLTHQLNMRFSSQRLYYWAETLFADYRKARRPPAPHLAHVPKACVHQGGAGGGAILAGQRLPPAATPTH